MFRRKYRIGEDSVKQLCQLQQTSLYDSIITQLATYFCSTKSSNDKQYNIEESIVSGEQRLSTLFGINSKTQHKFFYLYPTFIGTILHLKYQSV